ncbi:hypothetical protein [Sphingobacterium suaedae]|uniref:DUF4157 domain-containing protein n=1 Tax=Sphingobacterium suaedae TaxID=1686402 RepID=A0ABW5KHU5_9SPHI
MTHKILYIKTLIALILYFNLNIALSQIVDNEQASSSIRWKQIETEFYRVIYPSTFENSAKRLVTQLPSIREKSSNSLSISPKKITLILQGNHLSQNGYVQLAPRKSEFYPIPSSVADNQEWLPNLALHELRHVAQFDKLTGRIKAPFFEQLALALYALNLPAWYFEGDAVQIETVHSAGGRGRLPSWEMPVRANLLSGKSYSFNKYVLGSFKDNVPSHYTIGFLMNTYMTNHYGIESHEKIMEEMRTKLLRPFNFQRAVKQVIGMRPSALFKETMSELSAKWVQEQNNYSNHIDIKTPKSQYPADFLLPQEGPNQTIFCIRSSPTSVNKIIRLDSMGSATPVAKTGLQLAPYFHLRGDEIVWDEFRKDARFGKQTYNVINVYNLTTKRVRTLTKNTRYYSPVLHPTRNEIAVVEVTKTGETKLRILNAKTGFILDSIPIPEHTHIQQPKFNASGDKIIAIAVSPRGTNLVEFDLPTKTHAIRLTWSNQQIERPMYYGNTILFKAHFDGIDNIYQVSNEGEITQITSAEFGAFNPSLAVGDSILFNTYRYNGYKLAKQAIRTFDPKSAASRNWYIQPTLDAMDTTDISTPLSDTSEMIVSRYNATAHMINFHSLSISSTNFESFDNYIPGIFWLSNDVLNTTQLKLGYEFDPDIAKSIYSAEVSYRKYLPIFTARYANRGLVGNAVSSTKPDEVVMFDYRDHLATFDVSIPLSIYRRNIVYSYGLNAGTSYNRRYNLSVQLKNFHEAIAFPLNYQIYFNRNSMRSKMDLAPRWGQNFSVTFRHLPFERTINGQLFSIRTNFYFPGLWRNHSLQIRFAAQKGNGRYNGVYDIPLVSGWGHFKSPIVHNTAMATYRFPLFYPDWSIGSIAYIKRFQALLFSDFQNVWNDTAPKSLGIGLSTDFHVFRYVLPDINVAAKLTYINDRSSTQTIVPTFGLSYSY